MCGTIRPKDQDEYAILCSDMRTRTNCHITTEKGLIFIYFIFRILNFRFSVYDKVERTSVPTL